MSGQDMLNVVLVFATFLETIVGFALLADPFMNYREPKRLRLALASCMMILVVVAYCLVYFLVGTQWAALLAFPTNLMFCLWFVICSKDKFFVSLFTFLTMFNVMVAINCIGDALTIHWAGNAYQIEYMLVRAVIYAALFVSLRSFVHLRFRKLVDTLGREWRVVFLVPLAFAFAQMFLLYYPTLNWDRDFSNWFLVAATYVLFAVVYYVILVQAESISEKYALETRIVVTEKEYLATIDTIEQVRRIRHDMEHHMSTLSNMMVRKDYDAALAYLESLEAELPQKPLGSRSFITAGFIDIYRTLCEEQGVIFSADISFDEEKVPDKTHLGVLLGNALKNASEAAIAAEGEQRYVGVEGRQVRETILIVVRNGYSGALNRDYATTKPNAELDHGFGLDSIRRTLERCDGYLDVQHTDTEFTLTMALPIESSVE